MDILNSAYQADYYYNGQQRLCLWMATPNHAGTFLAAIIPYLWIKASLFLCKQGGLMQWAFYILEFFFCILLFKTYSRGAILALTCALVVAACLNGLCLGWKRAIKWFVLRLASYAVCGSILGFFSRSTPAYILQDTSATNRLSLWRAGMEMMSAAFPGGWGSGTSGNTFEQWWQPFESSAKYKSLVNSYLTVGAEQGVWVLAIVVSLICSVIYVGMSVALDEQVDTRRRFYCIALTGSLIAIAVGNWFSTLLVCGWTNALFVFNAGMLICFFAVTRKRLRFRFLLGLPAGLFLGLLICIATFPTKNLAIRRNADSSVSVGTVKKDAPKWVVVANDTILNQKTGKIFRQIRSSFMDDTVCLQVYIKNIPNLVTPDFQRDGYSVVLANETGQLLQSRFVAESKALLVIEPVGLPPQKYDNIMSVKIRGAIILTSIDRFNNNKQWHEWATSNNYDIKVAQMDTSTAKLNLDLIYDSMQRISQRKLNEN